MPEPRNYLLIGQETKWSLEVFAAAHAEGTEGPRTLFGQSFAITDRPSGVSYVLSLTNSQLSQLLRLAQEGESVEHVICRLARAHIGPA